MALDTAKFTLPSPTWLQTLRYNEWWRFKVPFLLGIYFWQIDFASVNMQILWQYAALLVVWMFGAAGFGYFVNDCFDIEQDAAAGKPNKSGNLSVPSRWLVAVGLLVIALLPWVWLPGMFLSYLLIGVHLLSFLLYSIPPIRFKERYYLGAITDALYSYFLPVLLVAYTAWMVNNLPPNYYVPSTNQGLALAAWALAAGIRNIIQHHILDRRKDRISGTANIINRYGLRFNVNMLRWLFIPLEIALFAATVYFTEHYEALLYSLLGFFCIWQLLPVVRINLRHPLNLRFDLGMFTLNAFYEIYLPFGFLIAFAIAQPWYWATILPYHFFFPNPLISFTLWVLALIFHHLVLRWLWIVRLILSRIVNYSIHYTRVAYRYSKGIKPYDPRKSMTPDNHIVNGLWIGTKLSNIELLTMMTFMEQGHRFRLWVYEPLETAIPQGVELMDANIIIPAERIFRYKHANAYGHGKGSVSGFSDIFRYKLLHDEGGWWVDMDVACLKPLNFKEEYVFRNHHSLTMVGNVMKCPKGSILMWNCYEEAMQKVTDENRDWHLPIQILNDQIESHGLSLYIKSGISNYDKWDELKRFVLGMKTPPSNYYFIHWMNEEWRSRGLDKNKVKARTLLGKMMIDRRLMPAYYSLWHLMQEELYYSKIATYLPWLKDKTPQSLHR